MSSRCASHAPAPFDKRAITRDEQRVISRIGGVEKKYRRAVLNAIAAARRSPGTLSQIARLIEMGRVEEAIAVASRAGAISLANEYAGVYTAAGAETSGVLGRILGVTIDFDQSNERAVAHIRQERFRHIREFGEEQTRATRLALTDGVKRGLNPREQARAFRRSIGLTTRQQQSVINFRTYLERAAQGDSTALQRKLRDRRFDPTIRRALRTGDPLTPDQIERMTGRYRERYIKYRSEVIARTESLRAVHVAQDDATNQAIDEGHVDRDNVNRTWITSVDGRERDSHRLLNGVVRKMEEPFPGLAGLILYPGDPNAPAEETIQCRCSLAIRVISLSS